jgi:glycosyltransferase involved in cell wall biosynthesis
VSTISEISQKIDAISCCILIPTYNNHKTLKRVIDGVLKYTSHVIIINDGSTDTTKSILSNYSELEQIHLEQNKGKGNALRIGLKKAEELDFEYALSIDSDGQHYPDDIPLFIEELTNSTTKNMLLIGARNLNAKGMPRKNSFANKFSNFWYWAETGHKLQDTQSGFRLYPVKVVNQLKFLSTKYEFEVEVMVKASWRGVLVKNIPIRVLYDPLERVSHYRPFIDFVRISAINTWLLLIAIVYIKPRDFYRKFKQKGFKRFFKEDLIGSNDSTLKKSLSIALGTFIGISPFWGFHSILSIVLAAFLKLNKTISFAFSNVSFPIFIPFIIYGSLKMGGLVVTNKQTFNFSQIDANFDVKAHLIQYVVGSFVLATGLAVILGLLGFVVLSLTSKTKTQVKHG